MFEGADGSEVAGAFEGEKRDSHNVTMGSLDACVESLDACVGSFDACVGSLEVCVCPFACMLHITRV